MTFRQLLEIADEGYADKPPPPGHKYAGYKPDPRRAMTSLLYHLNSDGVNVLTGETVDTLARHLARELKATFNPNATDEQQLEEAKRVMEFMTAQVEETKVSFELALSRLRLGEPYHAGN